MLLVLLLEVSWCTVQDVKSEKMSLEHFSMVSILRKRYDYTCSRIQFEVRSALYDVTGSTNSAVNTDVIHVIEDKAKSVDFIFPTRLSLFIDKL